MRIEKTAFEGLLRIYPDVHRDKRGLFCELWHAGRYEDLWPQLNFVQDNFSVSVKGTLRGLHFQKEFPQGKLVRVIRAHDVPPLMYEYEDGKDGGEEVRSCEVDDASMLIAPGMAARKKSFTGRVWQNSLSEVVIFLLLLQYILFMTLRVPGVRS